MAQIHGVAGEWARVKGTVMGLWPLFFGCAATGFALAVWIFVSGGGGALLTLAAVTFMGVMLLKGLRHVERFYKGARGEERVAGILKSLPSAYHVFNDFVAGRQHVDHVVVGPAGVYAIETKFWRGEVTVEDGHVLVDGRLPSRSPLGQVRREAAQVRSALAAAGWTGDVMPVLAFASDTFRAQVAEVDGVVVINSCSLASAFAAETVVIAPAELQRLVGLMGGNV